MHSTTGRGDVGRRLAAVAVLGFSTAAPALEATPVPSSTLQEILVIGTTPVPGATIDIDKVPGNVQSLLAGDLARNGTPTLTGALFEQLGSVGLSDNLADPFQPDISYRGFEASPVLGTPQGIAVYQNGVRINEAFGDSVNWDLIPDIAIERLDIVSSSPLYGLNALGGAMAVTMKNGFSHQGAGGQFSAGSFGRRDASAEAGCNDGTFGVYAAARALDENGWRHFAHDLVRQYYLEVSLRGDLSADLSYSRADNHLYGPGAAPVQSLAVDRGSVFTGPQANADGLDFITLDLARALAPDLAVQGVGYVRRYRQDVSNGNGTDFTACTPPAEAGFLCQADGLTPLRGTAGAALHDLSDGGTRLIGRNDFEAIRSQTWGGSVQFSDALPLSGHGNRFAVGASVDASHTRFMSGTQIGVIDASLIVLPSTLYVDTPEGTPFSATPVILNTDSKYYGFYATDTVDVLPALALTVSGRYNVAQIGLSDQRGTDLDGHSRFAHFNPAIGATYGLSRGVTAFAGYAINNRTPTASEIECSDPARPCLLPSSLAGDPPTLKQVVTHAQELGLRRRAAPGAAAHLSWNASLFRTDATDDIYGVATSVSTGFFRNIGTTRRQGVETGINYAGDRWSVYGQYSFIDATFRSPLVLNSPSNPFSGAGGNIRVRPGDRLPGTPRSRLKAGADYSITAAWSAGSSVVVVGNQIYHGDESNQNAPLPGYAVVNLRSTYRVGTHLEIFGSVQNLFDRRYATYGLFGDPTGVGAPGIPASAAGNDPGVDNRFQNPAAPRSIVGGFRVAF